MEFFVLQNTRLNLVMKNGKNNCQWNLPSKPYSTQNKIGREISWVEEEKDKLKEQTV